MQEFLAAFLDVSALLHLLVGEEGNLPEGLAYPNAVFSAGCFWAGFMTVILDYLLFLNNRSSVLKLNHSGFRIFKNLFIWSFGPLFGGLLGSGFGIFQTNRIACIAVGIGWTMILPRLLADISEDLQEEVQKPTSE